MVPLALLVAVADFADSPLRRERGVRIRATRVGADTTLALCSGMFDAMSGQVVTLDRGAGFVDNIATLGPRLLKPATEAT